MIDQALRSKGVGASEIAAICGLDPRQDAHDVWARKTSRLKGGGEWGENSRPAWGKRLQEAIIQGYAEITKRSTKFVDETYQHPVREWQIASPDAFILGTGGKHFRFPSGTVVIGAVFGCDAKNTSLDQAAQYGEGGEDVPDSQALQCQWSCSTFDMPMWDVAALIGGSNLRTFRIHRDEETEKTILEVADEFWRKNVLEDVEPPIGTTEGAKEYLHQRFPRNVETLRLATDEEYALMERLRVARDLAKEADDEKTQIGNAVRLAIGDADGIVRGRDKITWKKEKDSHGTNWEAVAADLALIASGLKAIADSAYKTPEWLDYARTEHTDATMASVGTIGSLVAAHRVVTRVGARKLLCTFKEDK